MLSVFEGDDCLCPVDATENSVPTEVIKCATSARLGAGSVRAADYRPHYREHALAVA